MTPENDVNNEPGQNADGNPDASGKTDAAKTVDDAIAKAKSATDTQSQHQEGDAQQPNDIDRAAQAESDAQITEPELVIDDDDPLGFGHKKMDGSGSDEGDELSTLRAQLSDSEERVASQQDQLLRIQAEMENQRKRAQNDVTKAHKFALEKIALDLLPVKDSLEMGLVAATADDAEPSKIIEGSELTLKMLAQALEKYNIVELNPVDEKFDPEFHQAMSMQPVEGKEPNTVASVMQKGYTLNDRLIRPALVMVAK